MRTSAAARGSSRKVNTRPEVLLKQALLERGFRYHSNRIDLPGKPDIVFPGMRVAVFVDGDFWHGKNWQARKAKLSQGHNADYWMKKIKGNIDRDRQQGRDLHAAGWLVLRVWESEISTDMDGVIRRLKSAVRRRSKKVPTPD